MDLEKVLKELESGEALLIDVREQSEWNEDHLKNAILHPISQLTESASEIPTDIKIYTHCRRGGRAQEAAKFLQTTHKEVIPLKYTFEELKKAGL